MSMVCAARVACEWQRCFAWYGADGVGFDVGFLVVLVWCLGGVEGCLSSRGGSVVGK